MVIYTCDDCQHYVPDDVEETVGCCALLKCGVFGYDTPCRRFEDKEY